MKAFVPCAAGFLLLISVYLLSTHVTPKITKPPLPLEKLPSTSLRDLHDDLVRGSMKLDLPVTNKEPETSWSLPARVHFIWIGPRVIRDKYIKNINNFCQHNPDYQVILWLERNDTTSQLSSQVEIKDVKTLINSSDNETILRQITRVVIKADLLRYEVVFKYGGIYLDTDTISVRPLHHHLRDSFVAFSRSWHNLPNSIFGFPQGSHFLKFVLESARAHFTSAHFEKLKVPQKFGPTFFTTMFVQFNDTKVKMISADYLLKNKTKLNFLIQTNDCNWCG